LCQLDVTGPDDCGLVYLVMHDPELRQGLHQWRNSDPADAGDPEPPAA
jgi:hypothetical protein